MNIDWNVERRGSDDPHEGPSSGNGLVATARDRSIHLKQGGVLLIAGACATEGRPVSIKVLSQDDHGPPIVSVDLRILLVTRAISENKDALELMHLEVSQ